MAIDRQTCLRNVRIRPLWAKTADITLDAGDVAAQRNFRRALVKAVGMLGHRHERLLRKLERERRTSF